MQPNIEPVDQLALRLWSATRARDWELVRTLMHPDADLQTGIASDQLLDREHAITAAEVGVAAEVYDPRLHSFEALDGHTALVAGDVLHRHPGERIETRHVVWLFTFEADLLRRSRIFNYIAEALEYHSGEIAMRGSQPARP